MDREEERTYAEALAEVTAPGAVALEELTDRRAEEPPSGTATPAEDLAPATEGQVEMELDPSPVPPVIEVEGAPPKRTLRFADEAEDEVKPSKKARFASPGPSAEAEAGPSRRARFASPDAEATPPKRARFTSPPPAPVFNAERDAETPTRVRVASPPHAKQGTDDNGDAGPPRPSPPPADPEPETEHQQKHTRFE